MRLKGSRTVKKKQQQHMDNIWCSITINLTVFVISRWFTKSTIEFPTNLYIFPLSALLVSLGSLNQNIKIYF